MSKAWQLPERDRLFAHVEDATSPTSCWQWVGFTDQQGYGRIGWRGQRGTPAYRAFYELLVGPIPAGLDLDHTCHTADPDCEPGRDCPHRRCVNPAHLEPVTRGENSRRGGNRKVRCKRGHEFTPENTGWNVTRGARFCRTCREAWRRERAA